MSVELQHAILGLLSIQPMSGYDLGRAFGPLRERVPQLQTWVAPGMHHPWSQQDPELFTRMVLAVADDGAGRWRPAPPTHADTLPVTAAAPGAASTR